MKIFSCVCVSPPTGLEGSHNLPTRYPLPQGGGAPIYFFSTGGGVSFLGGGGGVVFISDWMGPGGISDSDRGLIPRLFRGSAR